MDESQTQGSKSKYFDDDGNVKGKCDKMYIYEKQNKHGRKNLYNSWVTTIIFGCFIFVLDGVLSIFEFFIYKDSWGTSGAI